MDREGSSRGKSEAAFYAADPSAKYSTLWTVTLVAMLVVALGVIAFLLVKGGTGSSVVDTQEKFITYNQIKGKYDQSLVAATNKLIEAENSFNVKDYAEANDTASEAEDSYSQTVDYLYDLKQVPMGDEYSYLDLYYDDLEKLASLGEDMSSSLAYAARSADRGKYSDATKSLQEYTGAAADADLILQQINTFKTSHIDFFGS